MIELSTDFIVGFLSDYQTELVIWSHGFFVALALRRARIERVMNRIIPVEYNEEK